MSTHVYINNQKYIQILKGLITWISFDSRKEYYESGIGLPIPISCKKLVRIEKRRKITPWKTNSSYAKAQTTKLLQTEINNASFS